MRNARRRDYDDEYGSGYPLLERRPRNRTPGREIGQSVVAKLLSTVTEEALKSAVFSVALAVPAIRRTVFSLFLAVFLLGAILKAPFRNQELSTDAASGRRIFRSKVAVVARVA